MSLEAVLKLQIWIGFVEAEHTNVYSTQNISAERKRGFESA